MDETIGTGASWENLREDPFDVNTICSTVMTADRETLTEEFQTGLVGSQAASSASQIGTEPLVRAGTQTLIDPDSALSIPKTTVPEMFSISTSETVPTAGADRAMGAVDLRPHRGQVLSSDTPDIEVH